MSALPPKGRSVLIYPSPLASPGRVTKIARSLQSSGLFLATDVVGVDSTDLPLKESLGPGTVLRRIRGAHISSPLGSFRIFILWQWRVLRAYRRTRLAAVAAQNLFVLPVAHALARRSGAVFAYNPHELETETIASTGVRQRIQRVIERHYIRRVDVVSVVNESIADWYRRTYPGVEPVVLTNSPVEAGGPRARVDLRAKYGIPAGELLFIHAGYITWGRNVPLILRAFAAHPHCHVVFLGDGALRSQVEEAARKHPNIYWHPPVPPEEVVSHMRGADVGLNLIEHVSLSGYMSTPNKMMEALAAGIPPLSSDLPEARRFLGPLADRWILTDPDSQLDGALESITDNDLKAFAAHAPTIPSWDSQAEDLVAAYARALDNPRSRR